MPITQICKNLYQAAYYMTQGAELIETNIRTVAPHQIKKKGHRHQWYVTLKNVPLEAITLWKENKAEANVQHIEIMRFKLKRAFRKYYDQ